MGNPQNYSIELPQRCLTLLDNLWNEATQTYPNHTDNLGPLTSTFLISMSMPIINIPTERIEKYLGLSDAEGYVDDRHIDTKATEAFKKVLQRQLFGQSPFFMPGHWRFYEHRGESINLSNDMPEKIAAKLDQDEAADCASAMQASQWLGVIRNALAHGGVVYLDEHGRSNHNAPVRMFGFVSGKFDSGPCPHQQDHTCRANRVQVGLNILRISEVDYLSFLHLWVDWMQGAGLTEAG